MKSQAQIREDVTSRIAEALKAGGLPPWRKPWRLDHNCGAAANVASKRFYSGVNPILLSIASARYGFQSRWWATFKQWDEMGGKVMRRPEGVEPGDWGTQIVFCSPVTKDETDDNGKQVRRKFFLLKTYVVFNVDQVRGDHLDNLRAGNAPLTEAEIEERFHQADAAIAATGADIRYGGNSAFFQPAGDFIQLPPRQQFDRPEFFYETAGHELVHWTEVPHRLNWNRAGEGYAMGELVAEIGACFLAAELGLPTSDDLTRHCSYLKSWLNGLNDDVSFIFRASAQASKAVDYLMSFSREREPLIVV